MNRHPRHAAARPGVNYLKRAIVAFAALGANQPADAVYPVLLSDSQGNKLASPDKYVVTFPEGQLPPVGAFWSLTLYDGVSRRAPALNPFDAYRRARSRFEALRGRGGGAAGATTAKLGAAGSGAAGAVCHQPWAREAAGIDSHPRHI